MSSTHSPSEIARFDALAHDWWNPRGPMRMLHRMNPARVDWVAARLPGPVRLLDIGCGAGLFAEAMARRGHDVLGLDASEQAIAVARAHAAPLLEQGKQLAYRVDLAEALVAEDARFDAVTALEVIEHVPAPDQLLTVLAQLLRPGGQLFVSTLNRTARSYVVAKLGAEYLLRLLPVGTHEWRGFVTPTELGVALRGAGLHLRDVAGMQPGPSGWRATTDLSVNYIAAARA